MGQRELLIASMEADDVGMIAENENLLAVKVMNDKTIIHYAAEQKKWGYVNKIAKLYKTGERDSFGYDKALYEASINNRPNTVRLLMKANARLRAERKYSFGRAFRAATEEYGHYNALVAAASCQSWKAVLSIIETVKANSTNNCGHDIAFYFACKYRNLDVARQLYAAGASIQCEFVEFYKSTMYQLNSMQWALLNDDPDMVCFLLNAGYELGSSLSYAIKNIGDGFFTQTMDLDQFVTLHDCRATLSKGLIDFKNSYQDIKNDPIFIEHACHLESIAKERQEKKEKAALEKVETLKSNKQNFLASVNDFLRPLKEQNRIGRFLIWKSNQCKDIDTIEQLHKSKDVEGIKAFIKKTRGTSKVSKKLSEFLEQNQVNQDFSVSIDMQGPSI